MQTQIKYKIIVVLRLFFPLKGAGPLYGDWLRGPWKPPPMGLGCGGGGGGVVLISIELLEFSLLLLLDVFWGGGGGPGGGRGGMPPGGGGPYWPYIPGGG